MTRNKNYKRLFGIIGILTFVGSIVFIKLINVYNLFSDDKLIVIIILPIVMLTSLILAFRYLDTFNF